MTITRSFKSYARDAQRKLRNKIKAGRETLPGDRPATINRDPSFTTPSHKSN
jgi:hypothetical protein